MLLMCGACRHSEVSERFRWESIFPATDSLVLQLERSYASGCSNEMLDSLVNQLRTISHRRGASRQEEARYHFWNARVLNKIHKREDAIREIETALTLSDSSRYHYDQARFRHLQVIISAVSPAQAHNILKNIESYHVSRHDGVMQAHVSLDLGNILFDIEDKQRALHYYMTADSLYKFLGMNEFHIKTSLNNASILYALGQKEKASEIISTLLQDSISKADFDFHNTVKSIGAGITDDVFLLKEAYSEIKDSEIYKGRTPLLASRISDYYYREWNPDSAIRYARIALLGERCVPNLVNRLQILRSAVFAYGAVGRYDTAAYCAGKYIALDDSAKRNIGVGLIYNEENRSDIEKYEELVKSRQMIERLVLWVIILAVAVGAVAIYAVLMRRGDFHRIEMARAQVEVERERRQLESASLVMTEKDNVLQAVMADIGRLRDTGAIPVVDSKKIENTIRLHFSNKSDHENMAMLFEKVSADFSKRLKDRFPRLSEGDIRLASYIKAGMSTKQISKMLLLQPDSVKKNRHRLRERLGLAAEESLEDLLRNI